MVGILISRIHGSRILIYSPTELREALTLLLPLPCLTTLQLSVAPNFLGDLDLKLYKSITAGLPALTTLSIGHAFSFLSDRIFLHPLAAFCSMLSNLKVMKLGTLDVEHSQGTPNTEWVCPSVKSLTTAHWYKDTPLARQRSNLVYFALGIYFPNTEWSRYAPKQTVRYL